MSKRCEIQTEDIYCYEILPAPQSQQKIKNKASKRNSSRKKKSKKKQQDLWSCLADWIGQIYRLQATFQKLQNEIKSHLNPQVDETVFYDYLHKIIELEVKSIYTDIYDKTQLICEKAKKNPYIDSSLIAQLYEKIEIIRQASPEIQRLLNYYTEISQNGGGEEIHQFLDKQTLKYVFKNDPNKDQFIDVCFQFLQIIQIQENQKAIPQAKNLSSEYFQRHANIIREILDVIRLAQLYENTDQQYDDSDDEPMINQKEFLTPHPELKNDAQYLHGLKLIEEYFDSQEKEEQQIEKVKRMKNKKKRQKKKQKNKKKQLKIGEKFYEDTLKILKNLEIDDTKRIKCYIPNEKDENTWLEQLKTRIIDEQEFFNSKQKNLDT